MTKITVDHSSLEAKFVQHLTETGNKRTLLSGPFGSGKSTFLSEIEMKDGDGTLGVSTEQAFLFFKIQPVNYSIASNDDVFELIKYDLIVELLDKYGSDIDLSDKNFSLFLVCQMFILERFGRGNALENAISAGESIAEITDGGEVIAANLALSGKVNKWIGGLFKKLKAFKDKVEGNFDKKTIKDFMAEHESRFGLYSDPVSALIGSLVNEIKVKKGTNVNSVLIVDDMDRLDPEHTFRLFNVFSAHYNPVDDTNKFGFDKIVFVCDLDNIRRIFHHRYGLEVDFSGYIDKFFSTEPFYFDNHVFISDSIKKIFAVLNLNLPESYRERNKLDQLERMVFYVVSALLAYGRINLRKIVTFPRLDFPSEIVKHFAGYSIDKSQSDFYILHKILKGFLHNTAQIIDGIKLVENKYSHDEFHVNVDTSLDRKTLTDAIMRVCFPILSTPSLSEISDDASSGSKKVFVPAINATVHYQGERNNAIISQVVHKEPSELNPFTILRVTFMEAQRRILIM